MVDVDISKSRVYVADDVSANRLLLDSILRRGGLTDVHLYGDGRQLLDAVGDQEPDLILLDLRMPDIDGYEVLRQLEGRRAGARTFLSKPYVPSELVSIVAGALRDPRP